MPNPLLPGMARGMTRLRNIPKVALPCPCGTTATAATTTPPVATATPVRFHHPHEDTDLPDLTLEHGEHHPHVAMNPRPPRGSGISELLRYNKDWAKSISDADPTYFQDLAKQQSPQYLWIGCSDSRVPANQIVGLPPGEVFVHRNVANVVARADLNCLSVVQFAVDCLKVEHVIVCGHYGCGGVTAALKDKRLGLVDNWIMHVHDVMVRYSSVMDTIPDDRKLHALCELNVLQQFKNLCDTHVLRDHWRANRGAEHPVCVHGWCYGLCNGIINPIVTMHPSQNLNRVVEDAVNQLEKKWTAPVAPPSID